MNPPDHRVPRPSVPHSVHRVPTAPQPHLRREPDPEPEPNPADCEFDPQTIALARRIQAGAFAIEDLLTLNKIVSRSTVVETRNDDRLRVDTSVSLLDSKLDGALTRILNAVERPGAVLRWKRISALAISAALTMGAVLASCRTGWQTATAQAVEPAQRAEANVEEVKAAANELETRVAASEAKHAKTAEKLGEIEGWIKSANSTLEAIAEKVGAEQPEEPALPKKKKGSK